MQIDENGLIELSIIIVNYNTFNLTCNCIASIHQTIRNVAYEVILIDNASKECDASLFKKQFPEIRLICLQENVGFGRANNLGMANARGAFFLLLNSDTVVLEGTIDKSVGFLKKNSDLDIIGCKSLLTSGETQLTVFDYQDDHDVVKFTVRMLKSTPLVRALVPFIFKTRVQQGENTGGMLKEKDWRVPNYYGGRRIGSLNGVFLLMKRSVWQKTKGFDPDFFMYAEETEWFVNRLRTFKLLYYPEVSIIHHCGKSDIYGKMSLQQVVSEYLFWYKVGYLHYFIYVLFGTINVFSLLFLLIFRARDRKLLHTFKNNLSSLRYAFFEIPRFSNKFGSRKEMLKIRYLKQRQL